MVDLRLLAVAKRLWDGWGCRGSIRLDINIKCVGNETLRRAKRADDDGRMEGLAGNEELGGKVLLGL